MSKKKEKEIIVLVTNQNDLNYWCEELRCSKEDLVEALSRVGNSYQTIKDYLQMNHKMGSGK